jgi:hypothetical protein
MQNSPDPGSQKRTKLQPSNPREEKRARVQEPLGWVAWPELHTHGGDASASSNLDPRAVSGGTEIHLVDQYLREQREEDEGTVTPPEIRKRRGIAEGLGVGAHPSTSPATISPDRLSSGSSTTMLEEDDRTAPQADGRNKGDKSRSRSPPRFGSAINWGGPRN